MFPTTIWTNIRQAGAMDERAMDEFARQYRPAVLAYITQRGYDRTLAEDLCQDVFVRLLKSDLLTRADPDRGRFRTLVRTVAMRTATDYLRKKREKPSEAVADTPAANDGSEFDQQWALHLVERAMARLRDEGSPYFDVLNEHLTGQKPDRNRLWHARKRLAAYVRNEIALTCSSEAEFEQELEYLGPFLQRDAQVQQRRSS